jgi:hypothetical protein
MLSFWTDADHYAEDAEPDDHSVLTIAGETDCVAGHVRVDHQLELRWLHYGHG